MAVWRFWRFKILSAGLRVHSHLSGGLHYGQENIVRLREIINLARGFRFKNFLFAGHWMKVETICSVLEISWSLRGDIRLLS